MDRRVPWRVGVALGLILIAGWPATGLADEPAQSTPAQMCPICGRTNDESASYPSKACRTLVRGAANTLLGWTEVIHQPAQKVKAGGNVFTGILQGIGQSAMRTLAGAGEVLTFWTPKLRDRYVHFATDCPVCMGRK